MTLHHQPSICKASVITAAGACTFKGAVERRCEGTGWCTACSGACTWRNALSGPVDGLDGCSACTGDIMDCYDKLLVCSAVAKAMLL